MLNCHASDNYRVLRSIEKCQSLQSTTMAIRLYLSVNYSELFHVRQRSSLFAEKYKRIAIVVFCSYFNSFRTYKSK